MGQKAIQTVRQHYSKRRILVSLGASRRRWTPVAPHHRPIRIWGIVRGIRHWWLISRNSLVSISRLLHREVSIRLLRSQYTISRTRAIIAPARWTGAQVAKATPLIHASVYIMTTKVEATRASSLSITRTRRIIPLWRRGILISTCFSRESVSVLFMKPTMTA